MSDSDDGRSADAGQETDREAVELLSYEHARDELVALVQRLERGGMTLEESIACWERGEALADRCEALLDQAQRRIAEVHARRAATTGAGPDLRDGPDGRDRLDDDMSSAG
jgi:exodeoxyribonuclease VII small subunit